LKSDDCQINRQSGNIQPLLQSANLAMERSQ
jgi:hypothetical protein